MEYNEDPPNYDVIIETLVNMFGDGLGRDVILTIVESVDGDLNHAANLLMNMMNENDITSHYDEIENESIIPDRQNMENFINFGGSPQPAPLPGPQPAPLPAPEPEPEPEPELAPQPDLQQVPQRASQIVPESGPHRAPHQVPQLLPQTHMKPYSATVSTIRNNTGTATSAPKRLKTPRNNFCCLEITRILENHIKGSRILILLRGVPGSGKSYLAKEIVELTIGHSPLHYKRHILSTDDYFMNGGIYRFDKSRLSYAHGWNQDRAISALNCGISPIIIDNTNIELWEMRPYFEAGVRNGYIIEVVEPNTSWAKKAHILCKKNRHNVSFTTIKRMLDNYKTRVTANNLFSCFNCHYPPNLNPPQIRKIPVFMLNEGVQTEQSEMEENATTTSEVFLLDLPNIEINMPQSSTVEIDNVASTSQSSTVNIDKVASPTQSSTVKIDNVASTSQSFTVNIDNVASSTQSSTVNIDNVASPTQSSTVNIDNVAPISRSSTVNIDNVASPKQSSTINIDNIATTWKSSKDNIDNVASNSKSSTVNIDNVVSTSHNSESLSPNEDFIKIDESGNEEEDIEQQMKYMNIQQQLEEMQKLEHEWEEGESWDVITIPEVEATTSSKNINKPTPPKKTESMYTEILASTAKQALESANNWSQISIFLPPWSDENNHNTSNITKTSTNEVLVEKKSNSTCIESGDTDIHNPKPEHKVLTGKDRDINFYYVPNENEKIPEIRMLDKSTMTKEETLISTNRCKNEEKHFAAFRKLFKTLPKSLLRDVFDKCCGDVNWAVDIILDGVGNDTLRNEDNGNDSDSDESIDQECDCVAAYDIIPDVNSEIIPEIPISNDGIINDPLLQQKKIKKETNTSKTSLQLKRQIEDIVVISENHYSDNCLKIRKMRRGELEENRELAEPIIKHSEIVNEEENTSPEFPPLACVPSTSKQQPVDANPRADFACAPSTSTYKPENEDASDNDDSYVSQPEETVPLKINQNLLGQLDMLFGGNGFACESQLETKIDVPISIASQIYALWMDSLSYQLDENDRQSAQMLKEDEEFARQLEMKENEMAKSGQEPEIPDFKEIMDMDLAISLYRRDIAEWRNNIPTDLAARLSRDKLFKLFPTVSQDLLTELLMAHDNSFSTTVEVLLMSTGRTDILEQENGVNKFIMEKEMEVKTQILEEERKALSEADWPLLPSNVAVDMSTVDSYRREAQLHLQKRNQNYQKAQTYVRRGLLDVACYYSSLANFHKTKYEHANSLAAVTLVQVHTKKHPGDLVVDLHFLHVNEAKEYIDLYIDTQIQKLKQNLARTGVREIRLHFITGRGLHSVNGRPRLKPAVKKRLRERGIRFAETNPGLVNAQINIDTLLSHCVPSP